MNPHPSNSLPFVTACVVNYNGLEFLETCLGSLESQEGARVEILFVDNASSDGSVEFVRSRFPNARVVENRENLGYNAGLNQGFEMMKGDYLLAMNTDIRLEPDYAAKLADCIERHRDEKCGYAQGKVRFMKTDGTPTDRFYSTGHLFGLNRCVYNRGSGQEDRGQYDREEPLAGANAACLLMARDMLEDMRTEVGVFDPLFFMYGGDVDFDWLAAWRGWRPWYRPEALAFHIGEGSSNITKRGYSAPFYNVRFYMMLKNDRFLDVLADLPRLLKRNLQDFFFMARGNPWLLWTVPIDLALHVVPSLRSRRATRRLRERRDFKPREWMRRSTEELRKTSRD